MDGSKRNSVDDILAHVGKQPWSNYTAADYTVEQWHAACLIHQHDGPPTSKGECKLPIKSPTGVVNENGVYAAAAALAGARGGVDASSDEKAKAARALIRIYRDMGKPPPPSLLRHSTDNILAHYGKIGMHWGKRKASVRSPEQLKKDLLADPDPTNIDIPVHKDDKRAGSGTATFGLVDTFYQRYVTHDDYLYVKYGNGDKAYQSDGPGPTDTPLKFMSMTGNPVKHSDVIDPVENVLAHYGKIGMHWGRRTRSEGSVENQTGDPTRVTLYSKKGKGIVGTSGGEGRLPHQDAKDAAAYKQIANKSSTHALSNKELQALVNRINLEANYSKIANASKQQSRGRKFIKGLLLNEGKQLIVGKKGPIVNVISKTMGGTGGALSKNPHRSPAYPVGVFKKSYETSKHRTP